MTDIAANEIESVEQREHEAKSMRTKNPLRGKTLNWDVSTVLIFCVVLMLVFGLLNSSFWSVANFQAVASTGVVLALLSLGQTLAILIGGFDLSVGGVAALSGVTFASLANRTHGIWLPMLAALVVVGGVVGLCNAFAVNILRINALIATLAMMSITSGIANIIANGLAVPLRNTRAGFLGNPSLAGLPIFFWVASCLAVLMAFYLVRTKGGRSLYVIGGNRTAAHLAGLRVTLIAMSVYVVCALLAALAGLVTSSELLAADPSASSTDTLLSITAVVLGGGSLAGGEGGVGGTLAGVLLLATLSDGLAITGVPSFYQDLATGVVLLLAVGSSALRGRERESA